MLIPGKLYRDPKADNYFTYKSDIFMYLRLDNPSEPNSFLFLRNGKEEIVMTMGEDFTEL